MSKWFLGEKEVDREEWGPDNCIWEPPSEDEIAAAQSCGSPADPYLVARVESDAYARRILAAVNACDGIPIEALERGAIANVIGYLQILLSNAKAGASNGPLTIQGAQKALNKIKES